jgi:hypothetical protein
LNDFSTTLLGSVAPGNHIRFDIGLETLGTPRMSPSHDPHASRLGSLRKRRGNVTPIKQHTTQTALIPEATMTPRTIYLSRLLGLFLLILGVAEIIQRAALATTAIDLVKSPPLLFVTGMLTLAAGLAIVLAHNVWRGGAGPIVVTLLGWALLLKGAAVVIVPDTSWVGLVQVSGFADHYALYGIVPILLGLYLTYAGFSAERRGGA